MTVVRISELTERELALYDQFVLWLAAFTKLTPEEREHVYGRMLILKLLPPKLIRDFEKNVKELLKPLC